MDALNGLIADRLRRERDRLGWSLAELAERSGVSRAMISKIERAEASPTAELLNRLCAGLGITLSSLFAVSADPAAMPGLARRDDQPEWRDPASGYLRRNVSPEGGPAPFEIVDVTFPAGQRLVLDAPYRDGPWQQLWLLAGEMILSQGAHEWRLAAGDCLTLRLGQPISFHNPGESPARYAVVIAKPERH